MHFIGWASGVQGSPSSFGFVSDGDIQGNETV